MKKIVSKNSFLCLLQRSKKVKQRLESATDRRRKKRVKKFWLTGSEFAPGQQPCSLATRYFNGPLTWKDVGHFLVSKFDFYMYACLSQNVVKCDASGRKACCHVADAFLTRLKVLWPISSLKISKMSKKSVWTKSSRAPGPLPQICHYSLILDGVVKIHLIISILNPNTGM